MSVETLFEQHLEEIKKLGNEKDIFETYDNFIELFTNLLKHSNPFGDKRKEELARTLLKLIITAQIGEEEAFIPYEQVQCVFNVLNENFGYELKEIQYYDANRLISVDYSNSHNEQ